MLTVTFNAYLGADAKFESTNDGTGKQIVFSCAHSEKYKTPAGDLVEKTTWLNCFYYNSSEKLLKLLKKGTGVMIIGKMNVSSYINQKSEAQHQIYVSVVSLDIYKLVNDREDEAVN